jgi:glycosyltransferase involved in cell wall biosynthesis
MENDNWYVSTTCTIEALKGLGFRVILHSPTKNKLYFVKAIKILLKKISRNDMVYIISTDNFSYDKFTLLKLFRPTVRIFWEIHGVEEELFWFRNGTLAKLIVAKNKVLRFIYSRFVTASFCLSNPLLEYSSKKLKIKNSFLISSVVSDKIFDKPRKQSKLKDIFILNPFESQKNFIVYWAGGEVYPWQSLDVLEQVARVIYRLDKNIIFVVVGSNLWHKFSFTDNIVFYKRTTFENNIKMASLSNVCLALYSQRIKTVTGYKFYYSPRKIIEFMSLGKPVIATKNQEIEKIITHSINGFVSNNDASEIAKLILLLKNKQTLSSNIGARAKEKIYSNYRIKNLTDMYRGYFKQ